MDNQNLWLGSNQLVVQSYTAISQDPTIHERDRHTFLGFRPGAQVDVRDHPWADH
jgi:hypothetical protein